MDVIWAKPWYAQNIRVVTKLKYVTAPGHITMTMTMTIEHKLTHIHMGLIPIVLERRHLR